LIRLLGVVRQGVFSAAPPALSNAVVRGRFLHQRVSFRTFPANVVNHLQEADKC